MILGVVALAQPAYAQGPTVTGLTLSPTSVIGGNTNGTQSVGTVTISSSAPVGGAVVTLVSSNTNLATVPGTVTVLAGQTSNTFSITSSVVTQTQTVTISATCGGATKQANLTILPWLSSLGLSPGTVVGGNSSTATLTLNATAPSGGLPVSLSSSNTSAATTPTSVTVPGGSNSVTFAVSTSTVTSSKSATVSATYGSQTVTAGLTVVPLLSQFYFAPTSVTGGASVTGYTTLNGPAPSGGAGITITSQNSAANPPAIVTVPANSSSTSFSIPTSAVTNVTTGAITAAYAGTSYSETLTVNPLSVTLSISPGSVCAGYGSATGTVKLGGTAQAATTITLSSNNTSLISMPSSVTVAAGSSQATFTVSATSLNVGTGATVAITANNGGLTSSANLTIQPLLNSISFNPGRMLNGGTSTGTVTLNATVTTATTVALSSSDTTDFTVPTSVTVSAQQSSATFTATAKAVSNQATTYVTATLDGDNTGAEIQSVALLNAEYFEPSPVYGGGQTTAYITFNAAAPSGTVLTLNSNSPALPAPATVNVTTGATSCNVPITTNPVSSNTTGTLKVTYNAQSLSASVTIQALLESVSVNPSIIASGGTATGTVTLYGSAPTGGATISLSSSNPAIATVPSSMVIGANSTTGTFTVTGQTLTTPQSVTITATYGSVSVTYTMTVGPLLSQVTVSPSDVVGGDSATGTVYLKTQAPSTVSVSLSSSNTSAATVPASVSVPAGSSSATFTVSTTAVSAHTTSVITATYEGVSPTATLSIEPQPTLTNLTLSSSVVTGGTSTTGTVTLSGIAPKAGDSVTLASDNTSAATAPASVAVASGQTQASFTVSTTPVASTSTANISATLGSNQRSVPLSIYRPMLTAFGISPSTIAGGASTTGTITLNGPAPTGGLSVTVAWTPSAGAKLPQSNPVIVPAGQSSTTFPIATSTINQPTSVMFTATNTANPSDPALTQTVNLLVAQLHATDVYLPKAINLQWYLSSVGNFLLTRDNNDGTGPHTITSALPNTATSYLDTFAWVSGNTYTYALYDDNVPSSPALLSVEQVVPYAVTARQDQAVDSRIDPRYGDSQVHNIDYQFGASAYKGGLFVGFANDNSKVGRSFAQFDLTGANQYPANGYLRTAKVYAYFVTTDNDSGGSVSMSVGCQALGSGYWNPAQLQWDSAQSLFTTFNPASPEATVAIQYDPTQPWGLTSTAGNGSASLTWNAPLSGKVISYTVLYGTASQSYTQSVTGIAPSATVTTSIPTLTNGTTYYFIVQAVGTNGQPFSQSAEITSTPGNPPPSPATTTLPPTINYWCAWPLMTDIQNALQNQQLLTMGWASTNEGNDGWAYFAKNEYGSGAEGPTLVHAWSLPTLVKLQAPATVSLAGQSSTSATGILTVNAIGMTGQANVNLSVTTSSGGATSNVTCPASVNVQGLNNTFEIDITGGSAAIGSYTITATYNGVTKTAAMQVTQ